MIIRTTRGHYWEFDEGDLTNELPLRARSSRSRFHAHSFGWGERIGEDIFCPKAREGDD